MAHLYIRDDDRDRLDLLAKAETRSRVDQFNLILNEAFERRGLPVDRLERSSGVGAGQPKAAEAESQAADSS